jgi:hypothetical protein
MVARGGVEPPTYRFSGGRSYQLSYLAGYVRPVGRTQNKATQTGLEPATFAVTGRRANQLRHWAMHRATCCSACPQRDSNPRCRLERAES